MPFITTAMVKSILQITTNDKDSLINTLIPFAMEQFHNYSHNYFLDMRVQFIGSPLQFKSVEKQIVKLTTSGGSFTDNNFIAGFYKISYSANNNKVVQVNSVSEDTLTCSSDTILIDEITNSDVIITKVNYPESLKLDLAWFIHYLIYNYANQFIASESLPGGYSVTFNDKNILDRLFGKYRIPY